MPNSLVVVLVAFFAIVYISYYYRTCSSLSVLQTRVSDFSFDMLLEKQPIVIEDRVDNVRAIQAAWFPGNHQDVLAAAGTWTKNAYKYALVHAVEATEILVVRPMQKLLADGAPDPSETIVAIQLERGQSVILPHRLYYMVAQPTQVHVIGVHDFITRFLPA